VSELVHELNAVLRAVAAAADVVVADVHQRFLGHGLSVATRLRSKPSRSTGRSGTAASSSRTPGEQAKSVPPFGKRSTVCRVYRRCRKNNDVPGPYRYIVFCMRWREPLFFRRNLSISTLSRLSIPWQYVETPRGITRFSTHNVRPTLATRDRP